MRGKVDVKLSAAWVPVFDKIRHECMPRLPSSNRLPNVEGGSGGSLGLSGRPHAVALTISSTTVAHNCRTRRFLDKDKLLTLMDEPPIRSP